MKRYYVYIIYSPNGDCYYRGFSENPANRLVQHQSGESFYTSRFSDWDLVYIESFETKREALIREKGLKKYSKKQIKSLMNCPKNELT